MTVAQQFIAGKSVTALVQVLKGRLTERRLSVVPSGLGIAFPHNPSSELLGYSQTPLMGLEESRAFNDLCDLKQMAGSRVGFFTKRMLMVFMIVIGLTGSFSQAAADQLRLIDGTTIEVDEAWEDATGIWYRRGGVTQSVERDRVHLIERRRVTTSTETTATVNTKVSGNVAFAHAVHESPTSKVAEDGVIKARTLEAASVQPRSIWIHLLGGARVEVDSLTETADGVWYNRGTLSIFIDRARIERIERPTLASGDVISGDDKDQMTPRSATARAARGWSTGSRTIDALIRQNGARHNVDPYLIFCVMEQESHFNSRAVSSMGAGGLMQLMPGTAARFGVRRVFDPAQNISGGTRYLKELLRRFNGRVDLVLASYNAGEGAVMKYGNRVPPYRETRNYVHRISMRYGQS